jgi:sirohydrochlorin cobaltochelatase
VTDKYKIPIVLTAFGTTSLAMKTYATMDRAFKGRFPGHEIRWAYTSRMVKDVAREEGRGIKSPSEVMDELAIKGHSWAVVQSLHLICGHEFYRMLDEIRDHSIRTSAGLPMLVAAKDYERLADAIYRIFPETDHEAVVLAGHGTDHPAWSSYLAFSWVLRQKFGRRFFVGVIENGRPTRDEIVASVKEAGFTRIRLAPLLLVAGRHFHEDLAGAGDSWKTAFELEGMDVAVHPDGLGEMPGVIELFCDHIQDAMDMVP